MLLYDAVTLPHIFTNRGPANRGAAHWAAAASRPVDPLPTRDERAPILVTGMHRSGTSWVGAMLSAGSNVHYIDEPLNVDYAPRVMRGSVTRWYQYICQENEQVLRPLLTDLLRFRYHSWVARRGVQGPRELVKACEDLLRSWRRRARPRVPLVKCPFCVFSIPWFIERLGARVVVTLRDPVAVVSSLKRLGWPFGFQDLLAQPLLMRDLLEPFRADMRRCVAAPDDIVGHGILLWRIIYHTVDAYRARYPQLIVAEHEALSRDPVDGFEQLFGELDLPFTAQAKRRIILACCDANPPEAPLDAPRQVHLDSRANLETWRNRLSPSEAARVRSATADVAARFRSRRRAAA